MKVLDFIGFHTVKNIKLALAAGASDETLEQIVKYIVLDMFDCYDDIVEGKDNWEYNFNFNFDKEKN